MTDDREAFLRTIRESPEDDAPRLVFADWLEEHGEPERAEFIRLQVEKARLPEHSERCKALRSRERLLILRHGAAWRGGLPPLPGILWGHFVRGFVEWVEAENWSAFEASAGAVFAAQPVLAVELRSLAPGEVRAMANSPHLARLTTLELSALGLGDRAVSVLARSPHLHRITSLYLAGRVDPLAGRVGGGTPGPLSDAAAARLLRKSSLRRLRRLDLSSNTLGARTAEALASSPATAGLEWLRLYRCGLRGAEVRTLAGSERLGALAWVDLESNEVGDEGARAIAASPHWRNVTWLDLRSNGITTAGAIALAQVDHFHPELVLLLEDNPVKQAGREALLRRFGGNVVV